MKVSTRVRYAVRALAELAEGWSERKPMKLSEVARHQGISKKYLEQLFLPLRAAGIVVSVRGPNGGYRLARSPNEINFFELFKILEGQGWLMDCLRSSDACSRAKSCRARKVWMEINRSFHSALKKMTLSDVIGGNGGRG